MWLTVRCARTGQDWRLGFKKHQSLNTHFETARWSAAILADKRFDLFFSSSPFKVKKNTLWGTMGPFQEYEVSLSAFFLQVESVAWKEIWRTSSNLFAICPQGEVDLGCFPTGHLTDVCFEQERKSPEKGSPRSRIPRLVLHPFRPKDKGSPLSDSPLSEEEGKECDMSSEHSKRTISSNSFCSGEDRF